VRTGSLRAMCRRTGPSAAMSGGRWTRVSHIVPTTASRSLAGHSPARSLACLSLCSWRRESVSVRESACRGRRGGRRCADAQCERAGVAMAIGCCTLGWRTIQEAVVQCGCCSIQEPAVSSNTVGQRLGRLVQGTLVAGTLVAGTLVQGSGGAGQASKRKGKPLGEP